VNKDKSSKMKAGAINKKNQKDKKKASGAASKIKGSK